MRRIFSIAIVGLTLVTWTGIAHGQSGYDLFQQALVRERSNGQTHEAIELYRTIIAEHASDRVLTAKALVQMGRAYEKLGSLEARQTYERVVQDYADQRDMAAEARVRLAAIGSGETPPPPDELGIVTRQVWSRNGGALSVSPDGRYLSFVDWKAGFGGDSNLIGHGDLAVYDWETGLSRVLTKSPSLNESDSYMEDAVWSPRGDRLAYSLQLDDGDGWKYELHLIGADGNGDRLLLANPEWGGLQTAGWSSDGGFILVRFSGWDGLYRIATVSVDDGSVAVIKTLQRHSPAKPLSLSPDGKYVVYDYLQEGGSAKHDVFILATDGSSETRLVAHPADDERPMWTPDGERVLFVSDRTGRRSLWAVDVSQGEVVSEPEMVRPDIGPMVPIGFDRNGVLFYEVANTVGTVSVANLNAGGNGIIGEPVPLSESYVGTNSQPAWSPDGNGVAYLSKRGPGGLGSPHLVVRALDTGHEREFPLGFGVGRFTRPSWFSGGKHIGMLGRLEPNAPLVGLLPRGFYRIDLASGETVLESYPPDRGGPRRFATDRQIAGLRSAGLRITVRRVGQLPDGLSEQLLSIYDLGVFRGSPDAQFEVEAPGFNATPLFQTLHMHGWGLSPDGRRLALASAEDSTQADSLASRVLRIMPVEGGEAMEVFRVADNREFQAVRWAPDGNSLLVYLFSPDGDDAGVWRVPLDGGQPFRTELPLSARQLESLGFHPDGSRIAFGTVQDRSEIWAMEGFPWTKGARR